MKIESKHVTWGALALLTTMATYIIVVLSIWVIFSDRLYPNVTIAGEHYTFKAKNEIKELLEKRVSAQTSQEIIIGGQRLKAKDIKLQYDLDKTVEEALAVGQEDPFGLFGGVDVPLRYSYNQAKIYQALKKEEAANLKAVKNPVIIGNDEILSGVPGVRLDYGKTSYELDKVLSRANSGEVKAFYYRVDPIFQKEDYFKNQQALDSLPEQITLAANQKYSVKKSEMYSWLALPTNSLSLVSRFGNERIMAPFWNRKQGEYNIGAIEDYLRGLEAKINKEPQNAQLGANSGKVVVVTPDQNGRQLVVSESASKIAEALRVSQPEINLIILEKKAEIRSDNLAELGLTKLISTGYSNFSGSPANRIHNVRTGASKFNGAVVAPGKEFSFNTILGPVDASTGYLPELVILENKTEPQFGGGLCQVSSTAFRAALNAGFPILERKAHAYPVSYYKPFGVDASIYLPKPDFRFRNDSSKYLLIQTRIVGKNLYFDFYGTKENRRVAFAAGADAKGAVPIVEKVTPYIYDQGARGKGSFSAMFYRFIYDEKGKLLSSKFFLSKYDSPDKYPH